MKCIKVWIYCGYHKLYIYYEYLCSHEAKWLVRDQRWKNRREISFNSVRERCDWVFGRFFLSVHFMDPLNSAAVWTYFVYQRWPCVLWNKGSQIQKKHSRGTLAVKCVDTEEVIVLINCWRKAWADCSKKRMTKAWLLVGQILYHFWACTCQI